MEGRNIIKKIKIYGGYIFLILSVIEIVFFTILMITPIEIDGTIKSLILYIIDLNFVELSTIILWLFILTINIYYSIQSIFIIRFSPDKINSKDLLKNIFFIGILLLFITIIKVNTLYQIQISDFNNGTVNLTFISLIQDISYSPNYVFAVWILFVIPSCYEVIYSLAISGIGLNKYLLLKEKEQIL